MERTEVSKSLNLIWHPHPISAIADREVQAFVFTPGLSVRQLLLKSGIDPIQPIYVVLDDKLLTVEQWDIVYPEEGQILNVQATILGGDGGGGSNTGQIIAMVAVIAIAIAAPYAAGALGYSVLATGVGAQLLTAGVMIAGSLIVGAIFQPKTNTGLSEVSSSQQESPTYSLSGGNNRIRPYESMPVIMGQHRFFPDAAMKPYTEYSGKDQYLYQIFHHGISSASFSDYKIGENLITNYSDYTFHYSDQNGNLPQFPGNVDSTAGAPLTKSGGAVTRTTSENTWTIGIDIEAVLFYANNAGGMDSRNVELQIEYRPVGTYTWLVPEKVWSTNDENFGSGQWTTISYQEDQGSYDENGDWTANVVTITKDVFDTQSGGTINIVGNSQKAVRATLKFGVPIGQYEVRITRNTDDSTDSRESRTTNWSTLKSYQLDDASYLGQVRKGLVIKASEQLNGAIQQLSCNASSKAYFYNGSSWIFAETSNPAHWFMDFAIGHRDSNGKLLYGVGMSASQLDLSALATWASFCDTEGLTFNAIFDGSQTAADVLTSIARCGFGSPSWASGKLGIVYDARQATPVAAFGMSNIIKDTFAVTYITEELADEIVVRYVDPNNEWNQSEVRVVVPGVATPVRTSSIDVFGCTNTAMAGKFANYLAAQQYYRRRRISWETDFQGFVCNRGDVVLLSHDLTQWAYSGRFVSVDGDTVSIDRHVPRNGSEEYLMLVRPDGSTTVYTVESAIEDQDVLTLTTPIELQEGYLPMDHMWFFSPLATPGKKVKILSVSPASESRVRITATDEYDEFYDAWDGTFIQPTIDTLLPSVPVAVTNLTLNNRVAIESGYRVNRVGANWKVSGSTQYSIVKVYFDGNLVLEQAENLTGSVELDISAAGTVRVDVTPVGITGLGTTATSTLEIGALDAPQPPASMDLTYGEDGKSATFTWPQVIGAQSYVVEIVVSGIVKRQLNVGNTRSYEYTFEQAAVDGGPFRSYTARVYSVANDIQSETYASASFSNPQIGQLQNASVEPMPNSLWFKCDKPSDADFAGIQLWVSTNSAFTPSSDTLVYDGTDTFVTVSADKNGNPLESGVTYYLYAAGYDVFGKDNVTLTAKLSASVLSPAWGLLEGDIETSMIESGLRDRIDLIDTTTPEAIDALNINNGLISKIRTNATDINVLDTDVSTIGQKLLEAELKIQNNTDLLYDAGLTIDSGTGEVYIYGVKENANEISAVDVRLSAAESAITLKASYTYVDDAILNAVIDPSQIAELGALTARVSTAEVDIDALQSEITLKASNADLDQLDLRVSTAEADISGLEGSVALKANTTDLNDTNLRVTAAEQTLSTIDIAEINQTVQDVRYINKQQDIDAETLLRNVLQGEANKDFSIESIAYASTNLKSYTDEGILAEASARLELAASLANTDAALVNESIARATADAAEVVAREALAARVTDTETGLVNANAAITSEASTRATADTAISNTVSSLTSTVNSNYSTLNSAITNEATTRATNDTALANQITTLSSTVTTNNDTLTAAISSEATTRVSADSALASDVSTLQTTVGGHTTSIQTNAESIDGIQGKYSVKVDNNGYVSGFGLISTANNGTPTSEFNIIADRFALAPVATDYSAVDGSPFFVLTSPTVIDGVTIPAGTYMKKAFIHDASITNAKIADATIQNAKIATLDASKITTGYLSADRIDVGSIDAKIATISNAQIADGAITNAKIGNAAITNAKIDNASVSTLKIAGNAVTVPSFAQYTGDIPYIGNTATLILSSAITVSGYQPVVVTASTGVGGASNNGVENYNSIAVDAETYVYVETIGGSIVASKSLNWGLTIDPGYMRLSSGSCTFSLSAGTYRFRLYVRLVQAINGTSVKGLLARYPSFTVLETKR